MLRRGGAVGRLRARQLWAADLVAVDECLSASPLENVFLRSEIRHGALRQGALLGIEDTHDHHLQAVAMQAPLVVPWAPSPSEVAALAEALKPQLNSVQLIVGPRDQVAALQRLLVHELRPARLLRAEQPHYAVDLDQLEEPAGPAPPLRLATMRDLEQVVMAGAAMHLEEVGFDPLVSDPVGFRERVVTLIRRGWIHVWMENDRVAFKAECSAVTPEAIQLQGVWTEPRLRGRGIGTRSMGALCRQLLEDTGAVTLFVNDFNQPAIRVYERVGFHRIGTMRSLLM